VVARVSAWLAEAASTSRGCTVLVVDRRATLYALQHLVTGVALDEAVRAAWQWQPGWEFRVTRGVRC
jgi:hypothetical protein